LGKKKEKNFVFFMKKTRSVLHFENSHVSLTSRTLTTNSFLKELASSISYLENLYDAWEAREEDYGLWGSFQ
jgi:hypothetical protein